MISVIFFLFSTLALVILQTVIIPGFSWFPYCGDLMLVNVLCLCLFSLRFWVAFWLVMIGSIMDSISGGPFFLHTTVYLSIYLIIFSLRRLVFQQSPVFLFLISLVSTCLFQGLVMFGVFLLQGGTAITAADYHRCIGQVLWGIVTIPVGVFTLDALHRSVLYAVKQSRRCRDHTYGG